MRSSAPSPVKYISELSTLGEFGLIRQLDKMIRRADNGSGTVHLGIGDDAAVMSPEKGKDLVATIDNMIEDIHFERSYSDWQSVGWKAVAINLSDLSAMGAQPRWLLVNLVVTMDMTLRDIQSLYRGMIACGKRFGTRIVGGNTARSDKECSITITALGEVNRNQHLQRDHAKINDVIVISGPLGLSAAGLKIMKTKQSKLFPQAAQRHLRPVPRIHEIQTLLSNNIRVNACIDISDGLIADLRHICESSKLGATLDRSLIPVHPQLKKFVQHFSMNPYDLLLYGGEDYELLMTMPDSEFRKAKKHVRNLYKIGTMVKQKGIRIIQDNNQIEIIHQTGFRHF
jgi:thiamine-monophosphate kinase